MATNNDDILKPLTEQERTQFHDTYGEMPILTAEFDNDATVNYHAAKCAGAMCMTVWGIVAIPCIPFCIPAMRKGAESRQITLGENSLFFKRDTYCCCGPCMCNCSSVEQQVPLDKLQDLKLSQAWAPRFEVLAPIITCCIPVLSQAGDRLIDHTPSHPYFGSEGMCRAVGKESHEDQCSQESGRSIRQPELVIKC